MLLSVLLFLVSLFDFGGPLLAERVGQVVAAERRAAALEIVERVDALEARLADEVESAAAALAAVHRDHAAGPAEYAAALDGFDTARRELTDALLEARGDLRRAVSAAEWREVFDTVWRF